MNNFNNFLIAVIIVLSIVFFIRIVYKALFIIWLFQLKEYRFDRLFVHFRETKEGKRFFWNRREFLLWFLFILPFFYRFPHVLDTYAIFVILIFAYEAKEFIAEIRNRQLRRPIFTKKALLLTILTMFTVFFLSMRLSPLTVVFVDRSLILIVALYVFVAGIFTSIVKTVLILLAKRKLLKIKKLLVIGVTGSYGKSSTKDLIADFLSAKYKVLKTPGSVNTDVGIALFILKNLRKDHEVFVVEIGAYKRGEIASVCEMVKPTIGVLTGINEQHLSLFGSSENTKKAKFELIESLPKDGMAFFNGDDKATLAMSKGSKLKNTFVYSTKQLPQSIRSKKNPFLSNMAAAYSLAQELSVTEEMLKKKLSQAVVLLGIKKQQNGNVTILDDSFNANPNGFAAALDMLSKEKGKKILITPGIIELGSESARIHKELGVKIAEVCDTIILTNDNFEKPIREGLMKTKFDMKNFLVPKREELVAVVRLQLKGKVVGLLEGRMPVEILSIFNQLINQSTN